MAKDYYKILGIDKSATQDEIKRAYRKMAHKYHPDTGKGDEAKFKEVGEAYKVLGDVNRRAQYDRFGTAGVNMPGGGGAGPAGHGVDFTDFEDIFGGFTDFGDIFSDIFGASSRRRAQSRGIDVEVPLTVSFADAYHGAEKEISVQKYDACTVCGGSGAQPGKNVITCPRCHGQGQIRTRQQSIFGTIAVSTVCDRCSGAGKVPEEACRQCAGSGRLRQAKNIKVKVPAGIGDGDRIRIAGAGEAGYRGSATGDLYVKVRVEPDRRFSRESKNIRSQTHISFLQAILGDEVEVETVGGPVKLKIPPGTQTDTVFRLRNKGMPDPTGGSFLQSGGRGDHMVTVKVDIPTKLSRKQKKLLEELKDELT